MIKIKTFEKQRCSSSSYF